MAISATAVDRDIVVRRVDRGDDLPVAAEIYMVGIAIAGLNAVELKIRWLIVTV